MEKRTYTLSCDVVQVFGFSGNSETGHGVPYSNSIDLRSRGTFLPPSIVSGKDGRLSERRFKGRCFAFTSLELTPSPVVEVADIPGNGTDRRRGTRAGRLAVSVIVAASSEGVAGKRMAGFTWMDPANDELRWSPMD